LCCYWLAQLLSKDTADTFLLPGTHGIVFPWTPPSFGIPQTVLKGLEQRLEEKLVEVTQNWITHEAIIRSSGQSIPASQSSHEADEDIPLPIDLLWE
jgi:hypothetical protein